MQQVKHKEMSETVHTAITLALISGIVMAFDRTDFYQAWHLKLMGTPDDVIDQSTLYMRIYFLGMPFFMLYNYGAAILTGGGRYQTSSDVYLIISGLANAVNQHASRYCVSIWDVAGVAIATVISQDDFLYTGITLPACAYRGQLSAQSFQS